MSLASAQGAPELGELRHSFQPRRAPGLVLAGVAVFCLVMGPLELYLALDQYLGPARVVLSDSFRQDRIMINAILGVVFLLIAAALLMLYLSHKRHRVDLYTNGIVVTTLSGSTSLTWEDIAEVRKQPIYGRSQRPVNWTYTLIDYAGDKTRFRGLDGVVTLGRAVERSVRQAGGLTEE